jgi:hypothetical protein
MLNALLATFIRAIRVDALNPSHGAVVLAQYDRLGSGFDINIKVIVDFLRDLGMFKAQGRVVAAVIVQALQEVWASQSHGVLMNLDCPNRLSLCSWTTLCMSTSMSWHWRGP